VRRLGTVIDGRKCGRSIPNPGYRNGYTPMPGDRGAGGAPAWGTLGATTWGCAGGAASRATWLRAWLSTACSRGSCSRWLLSACRLLRRGRGEPVGVIQHGRRRSASLARRRGGRELGLPSCGPLLELRGLAPGLLGAADRVRQLAPQVHGGHRTLRPGLPARELRLRVRLGDGSSGSGRGTRVQAPPREADHNTELLLAKPF
jgi:hypothetical protein